MLTPHKIYLIKRNKRILEFVNDLVKEGISPKEAVDRATKKRSFNVKREVAHRVINHRYYPWSPFFEYDKDGNVVYERDWDGNKVEGTETKHYGAYAAGLRVKKQKVA